MLIDRLNMLKIIIPASNDLRVKYSGLRAWRDFIEMNAIAIKRKKTAQLPIVLRTARPTIADKNNPVRKAKILFNQFFLGVSLGIFIV